MTRQKRKVIQWRYSMDNVIGCEHSPTAFSYVIVCSYDAFNGKIRLVDGMDRELNEWQRNG